MTFDKVNAIIDDGGCDGYGSKLVRQDGIVYLVSISSDDGGVDIRVIKDDPETWSRIELAFQDTKSSKYDPIRQQALIEIVEINSVSLVSTSFWG